MTKNNDIKTRAPRLRSPRAPLDPWADWQPQWRRTGAETPHDRQEKLNPTEEVPSSRNRASPAPCRRRIVDARLWDGLSPVLQDAALEIARTYETLGRGLGFSTINLERTPGARGRAGVDQGRLSGTYFDWANACAKDSVSHSLAIDVLCYGFSCAAIDRDRRVRRGTTRDNLIRALELYARLRGWLRAT